MIRAHTNLFIYSQVFDIQRFKEILVQELKQVQPDRKRLEKCCLICFKFAIDQPDLLLTPCWVVVVHLIAIELLNMVLPKGNKWCAILRTRPSFAQTTTSLRRVRVSWRD
jgi:hypothetical protein